MNEPVQSLQPRQWPCLFRRLGAGFVGVVLFVLAAPSTASADLRVCNKTANTLQIAIGYKNAEDWVTEGWWNLGGKRCETIVKGPLASQFFYIYAEDAVTRAEWVGETFMCVVEKEFTIRGLGDCYAKGYDRRPFREIDTGKLRNWTIDLIDTDRTEGP